MRALLVIAWMAVAGCVARGEAPGTETSQAAPVPAAPGQVFEIRVPANESTGYHWALAAPLDSMLLAETGHRYIPSHPSGSRTGAGGMEVWRFEALQAGRAEVVMHYRRGRDAPSETRRYTVEIQ